MHDLKVGPMLCVMRISTVLLKYHWYVKVEWFEEFVDFLDFLQSWRKTRQGRRVGWEVKDVITK